MSLPRFLPEWLSLSILQLLQQTHISAYLNTKVATNLPVVTSLWNQVETDIRFEYGDDTSVYYSCLIMHNAKAYIYGGRDGFANQISTVTDCSLTRVGSLSFAFENGACTSAQNKLFLCFEENSSAEKNCKMAMDPSF